MWTGKRLPNFYKNILRQRLFEVGAWSFTGRVEYFVDFNGLNTIYM